jgi:hypothetical protein
MPEMPHFFIVVDGDYTYLTFGIKTDFKLIQIGSNRKFVNAEHLIFTLTKILNDLGYEVYEK